MTAERLFEDCQDSIERGHELWKSYFSKWETLAKYEEELPEDELLDESSDRKKSTKKQTQSRIVNSKKNRNCRKVVKKKKILKKRKSEVESIRQQEDEEDINNKKLETILKSVLKNILNANRQKIEVFAVLSQTFSQEDSSVFSHQQGSHFQFNNRFSFNTMSRAICPARNTILGMAPGIYPAENNPQTSFLYNFPEHRANFTQHRCLLPVTRPQELNFGIYSPETAKLKPLEWDFRHKFPDRVCRKINKEYFIKRSFPEMNITQDGKRFGSLCLRKRTNSVSLSMENSNFITPERKPSERKCFSENVLQRKRRRPSKVFFDNEVEDSESDDQTGNQAPIIHSKNKKFKPEIIPEGVESDSDDCESIFDRVKTD